MSREYERALLRLLEVPSSPRLGLGRMEALLDRLDNPHHQFRAVHVAGTNGKGSTVALFEAMARAAGLRTGRTTSPHLSSATERIALDGVPVSRPRFAALEERVFAAAELMRDDRPTFFERVVAMAFVAFAEHGVDIAAVEVGLGGRLDATNTVRPIATGVTRVAIDHREFLGDTLDAIAREKAGILKRDVPAVCGPQEPEARAAIEEVARDVGAPLLVLEPAAVAARVDVGLRGRHQRENAAVAWALADACALQIPEEARSRALSQVGWPGRLERVHESPDVWVDGAHNGQAMQALVAALAEEQLRPTQVVVGLTRGHDGVSTVLPLTALRDATFRAAQARAPRSRAAEDVAADLATAGVHAVPQEVEAALGDALDAARREGGAVLVTGSLYLVGEVRARFLGLTPDPDLPDF